MTAVPARSGVIARVLDWLPHGGSLPAAAWQARHRAVLYLVWAHVVVVTGYGLVLGKGVTHSLVDALPIAVGGAVASATRLPPRARALSSTLALVAASASLVHLSGGYVELHFHFFVMVAVVSLYQDWVVFLAAIAFVALHHGLGGVVAPHHVYNHPDAWANPWKWAGIHAGFVLFASGVSVVSWRLNEDAQAAVVGSELRYRALAQSASDAIITADETGRITSWNSGAERILGYAEEEVIGEPLTILMPDRFHKAHEEGLARFVRAGTGSVMGRTVELVAMTRTGVEVPIELALSTWTIDGARHFSGILRDLTERKAAEEALRREASAVRVLTGVAMAANEAETVADAIQRTITLLVDSTAWNLGHAYFIDPDDPTRMCSAGIWHSTDDARFEPFIETSKATPMPAGVGLPGRVLATGEAAWIADLLTDDNFPRRPAARGVGIRSGAAFPVIVGDEMAAVLEFFGTEARPVDESLLDLMVNVGTQIGRVIERDRAEQMLATQAMTDPLTGLPNRAVFHDRLSLAVARLARHGHGLGVLFVDLDRFKIVNDSMGHGAGDRLIQSVASRLRAIVRPSDTVARFGGDEFTLLFDEARGLEHVTAMAERVLEALGEPFHIDGRELFVTASIGIALADDPAARPEALLRDADAAMARAKEAGRAGWRLFDDAMRAAADRQLEVANALPRAIDRGELRVVYQPQVRLEDNRIVGFEALVRWQHPERGLIPPVEFVPVAEETGLIVGLGHFVLHEACRQAAKWQQRFPGDTPIKISVNLSPKQLRHPGLVDDVESALNESGIEPSSLVLELTESTLLDDGELTLQRLAHLKALGVRLSIDDFGTGYSSLSYLQQFPVDEIKIDRSFIQGLDDSERLAVVRAIVRLSQTLGLDTVAEGVEFGEHLGPLRQLHCDTAQGFLFARPLPAAETEALLAASPNLIAETEASPFDSDLAAEEGEQTAVRGG